MLTADEIEYKVPAESEMRRPRILEPKMTEQERAKLKGEHVSVGCSKIDCILDHGRGGGKETGDGRLP